MSAAELCTYTPRVHVADVLIQEARVELILGTEGPLAQLLPDHLGVALAVRLNFDYPSLELGRGELLVLLPLVLCRLRLPLHSVGVVLLHLPLLHAAHDPLEVRGRVLIDLRALGDLLPRAGDVTLDAARVGPREGPAAVVARPRPAFLAALLGLRKGLLVALLGLRRSQFQ